MLGPSQLAVAILETAQYVSKPMIGLKKDKLNYLGTLIGSQWH